MEAEGVLKEKSWAWTELEQMDGEWVFCTEIHRK